MPEQPLVSIIIPTYNRAHLIGETLDSVLAQTYQNWECLVVDDGSTDGTNQLMDSYCAKDARFQYHHRPVDRLAGGNAARNYGFEVSKGSYVQWFDSDDLMKKNCLKERLDMFKQDVKFVISGGAYLIENKEKDSFNIEIKDNLYKDYVLWKTSIFTPSLLFEKEFLLGFSRLFNESVLKGQESEFFSTIFYEKLNVKYAIINKVHFLYRRHLQTKSTKNLTYNKKYSKSIAFNHFSNLERGIILEDIKFIKYFYKKCLKLYFYALQNNDNEVAECVLDRFEFFLKAKNKVLFLKIKCLKNIILLNNKLAYKLFNHLKYHTIKL
ncbi:glycosyltransferase family 2 protein [Lacinutrix undariae]